MARQSNKNLKTLIYAVCIIFIIAVLAFVIFLNKSRANTGDYTSGNATLRDPSLDSLLMVKIPASIESEIIDYPGFTVSFNSEHKQPNWVSWELTREECKACSVSRNDAQFAPDPNVAGCASLFDYKGSGYDRGHMCPAGDMKWSQDAMNACFYLTNICPQKHVLNGGAWKSLEEKCREWADRDSAIIVICGPVLTDRLTRSIGENNVTVPERFFKVVLAPYADPVRAIGFIMPNSTVKGGMQAAAVSIDEVESVTGFDFFSSLPDEIENEIEAECNFPRWSHKKMKR